MASYQVKVVCATGSLGLTPFHEESFFASLGRDPDAITADAGSGDIGPYYLGADAPYNPREWEKHDLELMVVAGLERRIPVLVGSAGGAGTNRAVDLYVDIIREIARERNLPRFRIAAVYAEVTREQLRQRLAEGTEIPGLGAPRPLTIEDVEASSRVVAMMGVEPYLRALQMGADVIIAGRSCDDAIFAAVPIHRGFDRALSLHMGKTIECGPMVATPVLMRETVMGTVTPDHFLVEPLHPGQVCTPTSVVGHTLYERTDPYFQAGPGGTLDLSRATYVQHDSRRVRVAGSAYVSDPLYRVKLEGAGWVGHRAMVIAGLRDRLSIANLDAIFEFIKEEVRRIYQQKQSGKDYHIFFHVYGKNAVMQELEPLKRPQPHEVGIVMEVVASEPGLAENIAKLAKYSIFRAHYPGKLGLAGGAALLADEVLRASHDSYRWTIDHLLPLREPLELFPIRITEVAK